MEQQDPQSLPQPHQDYARQVLLSYPGVKVAHDIDFDSVWKLFLHSGFLYPEKVARLEPVMPEIQSTMRAMLERNGDVLATVALRHGDELDGHISLLRWCEETWTVQHLAAMPLAASRDATARLNLAFCYYGRLRPDIVWAKMYFRPNNVWPARVFGGFARRAQDPSTADLRVFHYLTASTQGAAPETPPGVLVRPARSGECAMVEDWFRGRGREAEIAANHLSCIAYSSAAHENAGLMRRRATVVAERAGRATGFALLEFSSLGMNFSELTNAFSVHMIDDDADSRRALIDEAKRRYAAIGRAQCVALEEGDVAPFLAAGFTTSKDYACFTFHRQHLEQMEEYFVTLFGSRKRASA
ncbi:MAG: hypothetical protein K2X03_26365 [Bryobacteraceae bacterium]|nr:hypothetical protein [Bryobacteraceae bacterium]